MPDSHRRTEDHEFQPVKPQSEEPAEHLTMDDIREVKLALTADLGRCSLLVREILDLQVGTVVTLDKLAGEMTDIHLNGLQLAKGEVVVIGDSLHVRIGEIVGTGEKEADEE